MASESAIKTAIYNIVGDYSLWTIGVTDNPARRETEHDNPSTWFQWDVDTEIGARNVEKHFLDKGMKSSGGGLGRADYVYIF